MKGWFVIKAGTDYEDVNSALIETNEILWRTCLFCIVIIIILVLGYVNLKDTVTVSIEMPSKIYQNKDLTIRRGLNWADASFYDVWGRYLAEEMTNYEPGDIAHKYTLLQKMMRPSLAIKKDAQIQEFVKNIVTNKIKQTFTIMQASEPQELEKNKFRLTYNGVAQVSIGTKNMPKKECHFAVDLKIYDDGVLYVEDFGTNCLQ